MPQHAMQCRLPLRNQLHATTQHAISSAIAYSIACYSSRRILGTTRHAMESAIADSIACYSSRRILGTSRHGMQSAIAYSFACYSSRGILGMQCKVPFTCMPQPHAIMIGVVITCQSGGCRRTCTMHSDITAQIACHCTTVCLLPYHQSSARGSRRPFSHPAPTRQTLQHYNNTACHRCMPTWLNVHATPHVPPFTCYVHC
jgi:hypothetical protein